MAAFVCGGSALLNVKPAVSGATCCCRSDTFAVASIGNLATDITIECEQLPAHTGDHQRVSHANIDLGGSLNVLIAASRLGAACAPVGFVSDDGGPGGGGGGGFGSFLMQAVARFGFSSTDGVIPRSGFTSPQCTVLVERGRGSTFLATNEKALPTAEGGDLIALPGAMLDVLRRSQSLVIDGYAVAGESQLVASALAECDDLLEFGGMRLFLDPQAVGADLLRCDDPVFRAALDKATALALTEDEARDITGLGRRAVPQVSQVVVALTRIVARRAHLIAVKRGAKGCTVAYRPDIRDPTWVVNSVPAFDVGEGLRDTTGCGDGFLGAWISGLSNNMSVLDAAVLANAAGAATAMRVGAGVGGVAERSDVERILAFGSSTIELP